MKFRKKPVVIEAFKWTGRNFEDLARWAAHAHSAALKGKLPGNTRIEMPLDLVSLGEGRFRLSIRTLEGVVTASEGDWIICGVKGEFYPCKPDIFEATYEGEPAAPAAMERALRERARQIAIFAAALDPEKHDYTQSAQLPHSTWEPHQWVVDAVERALREGGVVEAIERTMREGGAS